MYASPLSRWTIPFSYLAQNVGNPYPQSLADYQTLLGFYEARYGAWDSFLYNDPTDDVTAGAVCLNTVTYGTTGDGATKTFQLQRAFGAAVSPVYDVNSTSVNSLGQSGVNAVTLGGGGSGYQHATVSFVRTGGDTTGTGAAALAFVSGGAVTQIVLISAGVGYTATPTVVISGTGTGATATASLNPRIYLGGTLQSSGYTIGQTGIVSFSSAPGSGIAVTADAAFFWRVRFQEDSLELSNDYSGFWSCRRVILYQTRT